MFFDETSQTTKKVVGIKNPLFRPSGSNGVSHRKNKDKKQRQYLKNRETRAIHYSTFQGEKGWKANSKDCEEWHGMIKSLSAGTA